jgi:hypothetical protein
MRIVISVEVVVKPGFAVFVLPLETQLNPVFFCGVSFIFQCAIAVVFSTPQLFTAVMFIQGFWGAEVVRVDIQQANFAIEYGQRCVAAGLVDNGLVAFTAFAFVVVARLDLLVATPDVAFGIAVVCAV